MIDYDSCRQHCCNNNIFHFHKWLHQPLGLQKKQRIAHLHLNSAKMMTILCNFLKICLVTAVQIEWHEAAHRIVVGEKKRESNFVDKSPGYQRHNASFLWKMAPGKTCWHHESSVICYVMYLKAAFSADTRRWADKHDARSVCNIQTHSICSHVHKYYAR